MTNRTRLLVSLPLRRFYISTFFPLNLTLRILSPAMHGCPSSWATADSHFISRLIVLSSPEIDVETLLFFSFFHSREVLRVFLLLFLPRRGCLVHLRKTKTFFQSLNRSNFYRSLSATSQSVSYFFSISLSSPLNIDACDHEAV